MAADSMCWDITKELMSLVSEAPLRFVRVGLWLGLVSVEFYHEPTRER